MGVDAHRICVFRVRPQFGIALLLASELNCGNELSTKAL